MDLYAENILDHYRHPRCKKELASASVEHEEVNRSCGDEIKIQLTLDAGVIKEIGWSGIGCAISQASMSMLAEEMEGMSVGDVLKLSKDDVFEMLGVPIGPRRLKCALMSLDVVRGAVGKKKVV